jgi:kynurenine formamidase
MRDLTWTFSPSFPVFVDGEEATRSTHVTIEENGYYLQRWTFYEHTATHMDAPGHFTVGGRLSPEITLDELFVPAFVVDISDKVRRDHDADVTVDDLTRFERRHGRIPRRSAVLMYSGWETRAGSTDLYRGTDASGGYHFPGFDVEAVDWLIERRNITAIGVDTMSLDHGPSATFDVHVNCSAPIGGDWRTSATPGTSHRSERSCSSASSRGRRAPADRAG